MYHNNIVINLSKTSVLIFVICTHIILASRLLFLPVQSSEISEIKRKSY